MSNSMQFYKSRTEGNELLENSVVNASIGCGIVPHSVRYELQNSEITGIIKSTSGNLFFFHFNPHTQDMKTNVVDSFTSYNAEYLFEKSNNGFDLIKADVEDLEDEEKSAGSGAGGQEGSAQPAAITEQQAIAQQNRLMTEQHPGAAVGSTPDRPDVGRQWHQDAVKSLETVGALIRKAVDTYYPPVTDTEKQFMVEVLGRTPEEVDSGYTKMTPIQKVTYQKWLTKSSSGAYHRLNTWAAKHG